MTLMSDTPRTDEHWPENEYSLVDRGFAEQLERELSAALARVRELEVLNEELVSTKKFLLSEINALNKKLFH